MSACECIIAHTFKHADQPHREIFHAECWKFWLLCNNDVSTLFVITHPANCDCVLGAGYCFHVVRPYVHPPL